MVQDQNTQPQAQQKEEQFSVAFKGPITSLGQIAGAVGLDQPEEPSSPGEVQEGGADQEELFANAHPDDVAALEERMAASGRPRPQGAQIPESAYQMPLCQTSLKLPLLAK